MNDLQPDSERLYAYVGPDDIREMCKSAPQGTPIRTKEDLLRWLAKLPRRKLDRTDRPSQRLSSTVMGCCELLTADRSTLPARVAAPCSLLVK